MDGLEKVHGQLKQLPANDHVVDFDDLGRVAQRHQVREPEARLDFRLVLRNEELLRLYIREALIAAQRLFELLVEPQNVAQVVQRLITGPW